MKNLFTKDDFGKWDGTINWAKKFFSDDFFSSSDDFSKFEADIESLFWPIRTEKFWVNLTESESWFVKTFMPDTKDASVNLKAKMNSLKENVLEAYNSWRQATSLKRINEEQLLDDKALVDLYKERNSSTESITPSKWRRNAWGKGRRNK